MRVGNYLCSKLPVSGEPDDVMVMRKRVIITKYYQKSFPRLPKTDLGFIHVASNFGQGVSAN